MLFNQREFRSPRSGEIEAFLSRKVSLIKTYNDELQFCPCPKCHKENKKNPCIKINKKTGFWRCFACGETGGWYSLTLAFNEPLSDPYNDQKEYIPNHGLIDKFLSQKRRPVTGGHYPELLKYCQDRGINNDVLDLWRVSTKGDKNLRFPIYEWINNSWMMVNAKIKGCLSSGSKDWFEFAGGPTGLFIGNHLLKMTDEKRVYITEGQFDAMTASMIGFDNVLSLPNGGQHVDIGSMLRYIPNDWSIVLMLDMDQTGDKAAEQFYARCPFEKIDRCLFPTKDLNEWFMSDPFLEKKDVLETIKSKKNFFFRDEKFFEIDMTVSDDIDKSILARFPWVQFNDAFGGGILKGQTTGVLAPSGGGKTSFCNHIAIHFASNGIKVGHLSLEGTKAETLRLIKHCIKSYSEDHEKTISHYMLSKLGGPDVTVDQCLDSIDKMISSGAKIIIFDNIDFIAGGDNNLKALTYKILIKKMIDNKCHLFMVWQPHKVDKYKRVNSGSQKGFSTMFQDSDNYINLNRINDHVEIEIEKNRLSGTTNKIFKFKYNNETRLFDIDIDIDSKNKAKVLKFWL